MSSVGATLDDEALLHHRDLVGHAPDNAEVMGDEQDGHAVARLQVAQQRQYLRLHGHVERGGRLVGDQQVGPVGQGHGDHHALALAARQFMRIGGHSAFGVLQPDLAQQLQHPRAALFAGGHAVNGEDFADLLLDPVQRIERGHRLLEDHADARAAQGAQRGVGSARQLLSLKMDAPAEDFGSGRKQPDNGQRRHRFARTGFADEPERPAPLEPERRLFHGKDFPSRRAEADAQV